VVICSNNYVAMLVRLKISILFSRRRYLGAPLLINLHAKLVVLAYLNLLVYGYLLQYLETIYIYG
jgi:hypothetical protein